MERLTERLSNGQAAVKGCGENCKYAYLHCNDVMCPTLVEIYEKLASYEGAEEQGLLLRLPCKVGDTVYSFHTILECEYEYDCKEYDAYKCEGGCPCEFEYKVTRIREQQFEIPMIALLGKSVFLTKEKAEKALAEMEKERE